MGARATHIRWPGDDLSRSLIRHLGNSGLLATFTEWATDRRPPIAPGLDNSAYTASDNSAPLTCFIREGMATGHNCTATSAFQRPAGWRRAATSPYPETPEQLRSGLYFAVAVSAPRSGCFILQLPRPTQRPQASIVQERMAKGRNSNCTAPSVNKQQAETTG